MPILSAIKKAIETVFTLAMILYFAISIYNSIHSQDPYELPYINTWTPTESSFYQETYIESTSSAVETPSLSSSQVRSYGFTLEWPYIYYYSIATKYYALETLSRVEYSVSSLMENYYNLDYDKEGLSFVGEFLYFIEEYFEYDSSKSALWSVSELTTMNPLSFLMKRSGVCGDYAYFVNAVMLKKFGTAYFIVVEFDRDDYGHIAALYVTTIVDPQVGLVERTYVLDQYFPPVPLDVYYEDLEYMANRDGYSVSLIRILGISLKEGHLVPFYTTEIGWSRFPRRTSVYEGVIKNEFAKSVEGYMSSFFRSVYGAVSSSCRGRCYRYTVEYTFSSPWAFYVDRWNYDVIASYAGSYMASWIVEWGYTPSGFEVTFDVVGGDMFATVYFTARGCFVNS